MDIVALDPCGFFATTPLLPSWITYPGSRYSPYEALPCRPPKGHHSRGPKPQLVSPLFQSNIRPAAQAAPIEVNPFLPEISSSHSFLTCVAFHHDCTVEKMEQGREEDSKEPMESDPDYESGENTTFPKKENTLGRTQEVAPSQQDATPPPVVSDVLGSLARTLHQLSAATGLSRDVELPRYDGSYEAQSFFDNYDAQADLAQLQYTTKLRKPPNLLQAPLRVINTRADPPTTATNQACPDPQDSTPIRLGIPIEIYQYLNVHPNPKKGGPKPQLVSPLFQSNIRPAAQAALMEVNPFLPEISSSHSFVTCVAFHHDCTVELEPTVRARSLFSPLQFPTKDTSLVSLVLAEQRLVMELPLVSPASCELRSVIRFLAAKKNSAKDIHTELCQLYGEGCMSSGMVRRWVREFKNGRTDVHDEPRAGRPSVSDETIAKVEAAMLEDRRVTAWKLCDLVPDVSKTTIDNILREHLGYSKWVDAAQEFLDCHKTDGEEFLDSIVTGDVTLVHYTTLEIKDQSKQWKHTSSPKPLKFKQTLSAGKLIAIVFRGRKGLLVCDFMRRGTTINSDRYCKTLKQIRRAIQNKRRGMLTKRVRFHHDNARQHTAHQTTALIEEFEWELVSHPPYSPDVAPSDFYFFPELKKNLGGTQFQDDDELEEAVLGFYAARRQSSLTLGSIRCASPVSPWLPRFLFQLVMSLFLSPPLITTYIYRVYIVVTHRGKDSGTDGPSEFFPTKRG
ncbi:hypothetical protein LAZ67_6003692 [Cordylochernes scorpioides]|uniref:Mos1 transposase HTH domain-containing protein n=1 Tax=Cordylochernes scorpioides TaxID=51811 RepID=A0ABY6KQT9_9ARAC|nr:hypothetical protein LAZ67_6003692 [Cordylochernes scorpioides]